MTVSRAEEVARYFDRLGRDVSRGWSAASRANSALPHVAARSLELVEPPADLGAVDVLTHAAVAGDLPVQGYEQFGQPPVIVYREDDFYVQVLIWLEGVTDIHQHGFDGAFRVVEGSSLHVPYRFGIGELLADDHLRVGELSMEAPEVLQRGAVRAIPAGDEFIHALFHLERPSVTVVVRNDWSDLEYPQFSYRRPGLGYDRLHHEGRVEKQIQAVTVAHRLDRPVGLRLAHEFVASEPLWAAFVLVDRWFESTGGGEDFAGLLEALSGREKALEGLLEACYADGERQRRIMARRGLITAQQHRLFMALLANLPGREAIDVVLAQLYPGEDTTELLRAWIGELVSPAYRGVSGLALDAEGTAALDDPDAERLLEWASRQWKTPQLLRKLF